MNYKVSELEGALLDAAVAKAEGLPFAIDGCGSEQWVMAAQVGYCGPEDLGRRRADRKPFSPSENGAQGVPIIERERIELSVNYPPDLYNEWGDQPPWKYTWRAGRSEGDTPLIAAMRAYVASKFGDEVAIP